MPLGEAVVYLRRAVRRRLGDGISVRLVRPDSVGARKYQLGSGRTLPVVIIDGQVFLEGSFSLKEIIGELQRLRGAN